MIQKCALTVACVAAQVACAGPSGGGFQFREDFAKAEDGRLAPATWKTTGFTWAVREARLFCEDADKTFAILTGSPHGRSVRVEVTVMAKGSFGPNWKVAGAVVHRDDGNHWHLAMVESPPGKDGQPPKHTWELLESLNGRWLANVQGGTALPAWGPTKAGTWKYGVAYRLTLALTPEGIRGTAKDPAGRVVWQNGFRFPKGRAESSIVRTGRPALDAGGFRVYFDDLAVEVQDAVAPPPAEAAPKFPAYDRAAMSRIKAKATGFFRVQKIDDIWWLIDPKGYAFYDVGTDHARYDGHWCQKLGYAPYGRNMKRKFPNEDDWCKETVDRLKDWGFTTIAAGHSASLRHRGLIHTEFISFGSRFSPFSDITPKVHWTGFPNVFHPRWEAYCRKYAEQYCARQKDDPWLLGYFLDNELEWYGKTHREFGLVAEAWKKPAGHAAKQALVEMLRKRHGTIQTLNAAWGTKYTGFDALARSAAMPEAATEAAKQDGYAYLERIAERYFGVAARAIRRVDPNHMIVGSRFAGRVHDVVWKVAGKHCDVVSCNYYGRVDLETGTATPTREALIRYYGLCKRPMMLTEWSHPALDSGLPCTHGAGQRFDTQAQRAEAFRIYQTMLFSLPFMVGSHFFMWVDEPALGISDTFPENTNYGLVTEQGGPYPELTAMAAKLNPKAVAFHSRHTAEISVGIDKTDTAGPKACLYNSGKIDAKCPVEIWEDGRCRKLTMDLPAGKRVTEPLLRNLEGEVHYVVVRADPGKTLAEADRSDNLAARHVRLPRKQPGRVRALISVGNPTEHTLWYVVVRVPVASLWRKTFGRGAVVRPAVPAPWRPRQQLNDTPDGPELAFLVGSLPRFAGRVYEATPSQHVRPIQAEAIKPPFVVDNGWLKLVKNTTEGDLIKSVGVVHTPLGRVQALIHQNVGQDLWVPANRLVSVKRRAGPVQTELDYLVEHVPHKPAETKSAVDPNGVYAARRRSPAAYRAHYRLRIIWGWSAFGLQCLSVTNTDGRPWRLEAYFHYLPSHIGGSPKGDDVPLRGVPNYYGIRSLWFDPHAPASYGAIAPPQIQAHFWLDAGGGQHPDVRRTIGRVLKPGESWTGEEPPVWVFGVRGRATAHPWSHIADDLHARTKVTTKVWPQAR